MKKKNLKFTNSFGFTAIEALISLGIVAMIAGVSATVGRNVYQIQKKLQYQQTAQYIIESMVATLNNSAAWNSTVSNSSPTSSLRCLKDGYAIRNCDGVSGAFEVYQAASNAVFFDPNQDGFDMNGQPCRSAPSPQCPFRMNLSWQAICPSPVPPQGCKTPQVRLVGALSFNDGNLLSETKLNQENYNFDFILGAEENSLNRSCASVNGTFDSLTGQCTLAGLNGVCPPGQVVVNVTPAMNMVCQPVFVGSCGPNQKMIGFTNGATGLVPQCVDLLACYVPPPPVVVDPGGWYDPNVGGDSGWGYSSGDGGCGGADGGGGCSQ